jgi:phage-related protein
MANTLGDIVVNLTLNTRQFSQAMQRVSQQVNRTTRDINSSMNSLGGTVQNGTDQMSQNIRNVNGATDEFANNMRHNTRSIDSNLGSVLQSSRVLVRQLGTDFDSQRRILGAAGREFHNFARIGRRVPMDIAEQFSALPRHLQQYVSSLRDAGHSTAEFVRLNQMYSQRRIEQMRAVNDYLQQKTTQSARLMQSFARDTNLAPLTNGFLRLGNQLEHTAHKGTALNIALQRIGPNASLYDLTTQMRFVTQGIMRARGAFLVFGVASLLSYYGMIKLASAVDKRVIPAFDNMKKTWLGAMMPFITAFASGMIHVMNFITAIGKMVAEFSKAHPVIFKIIMSISMLALVLGALLAPLAVTGIWAEGLAASFSALWMIIGPFVLGFLAVIGVAIGLATALVLLYATIKMLWTQSSAFRNAWVNMWKGISDAFNKEFVAPIKASWDNVKKAYSEFVSALTGGAGTTANLFKWMGDKIAPIVNLLGKVLIPVLTFAFRILGQVVAFVFNGLAKGISLIAPAIGSLSAFGDKLKTVFSGGGNPVAIGQTISKVITMIIMTLIGGIPKLIAMGTQLISKLASGMGMSVPQLMQMAVQIITNVITQFLNMIPQVLTVGGEIIQGLVSGLLQALPTILNGLTNLVNYLISMLTSLISTYLPVILNAGLTVLNAIISGIVTNLPLVVNAIITIIQRIVNTLIASLPTILDAGLNLLMALVNGILQSLPAILSAIFSIITALCDVIIKFLPMIIDAGIKILFALIQGIIQMIPQLINLLVKLLNTLVNFLVKNLPVIIQAGVKILLALIQGIAKMAPSLITAAIKLIFALQGAIISNLPQIIQAGVEIIIALVKGLIKWIPALVNSVPVIVKAIWDALTKVHWGDIGRQIINGIKAGLLAAKNALFTTVSDIANKLLKSAKSVLGIHSPSREFAKQVGQWIPKGIAVGIENEGDIPVNAVRSVSNDMVSQGMGKGTIPFSSLSLDNSGNGNTTTHVTNHNNIYATVKELADIQRIADELDKRQRQQDRAKGIFSFRG